METQNLPKQEREFQTGDVYLAAGITVLLGTEPRYLVLNGKTFFGFPATDDLYKAMSAFNGGMALPAIEYATVIKRIRGEAISRRLASADRSVVGL